MREHEEALEDFLNTTGALYDNFALASTPAVEANTQSTFRVRLRFSPISLHTEHRHI
ncbi:hypothetical protein [Nitratifractor sp.]